MERNMDFIEELKERFLRYVAFDTQSDPESETFPSTAKQLALLNRLVEEMISLGMTEVEIDPNGYVTGTVPATPGCESKPVIGFIAHVDTSPDMKGADIRPRLIERYDGGDIPLNDSLSMRVKDFPELSFFKEHTLIVTDGTTLLGADDKAGVAEIMTAVETGSSLDREMIANFPAMLPGLAFQTYIRKNIDVKKAPLALQPLCFFSPRCTATGDYAALCDEMLARMEG